MRTATMLCTLVIATVWGAVGCSSTSDPSTPNDANDAGGGRSGAEAGANTGGEGDAIDAGGGAADGGTTASEGGPSDAGSPDASNEAAAPSTTSDAGADGAASPDAGVVAVIVVNGCAASSAGYADHTASGDARSLPWNTSLGTNVDRCMRIKAGQTVTWSGDQSAHPVRAKGGTSPSPIVDTNSGNDYSVTFPSKGVYGYVCGVHASMTGAIDVE